MAPPWSASCVGHELPEKEWHCRESDSVPTLADVFARDYGAGSASWGTAACVDALLE